MKGVFRIYYYEDDTLDQVNQDLVDRLLSKDNRI
jgi:hypothetical protein